MRTSGKHGVAAGFLALVGALLGSGCVRLSTPDHYSCIEPSDCNDDEVCSGNTCIPKGTCRQTSDCGPSEACSAAGKCFQAQCSYTDTAACAPYGCESGACKTSCMYSSDCVGGATCEGGHCVASLDLAEGLACAENFDCKSRSCCNKHCATSCSGDYGSCASAATCSGGYCCETVVDMQCRSSKCPTGHANDPCTNDSDCIDDVCSSNRCL